MTEEQKRKKVECRKRYSRKHREEISAYYKQWYQRHKEEEIAKSKQYNQEHRKEKLEYWKQYNQKHREEKLIYNKQHYQENREKILAYYQKNRDKRNQQAKVWQENHREQWREIERKNKFKRRKLGFIPLNEPFEGSDAHHIDRNYVIYIPKEIHQGIRHSVLKNRNMDEINAVAFNYLSVGNSRIDENYGENYGEN